MDSKTSGTVSHQMIKKWQQELQLSKVSINTLENIMKAFNAALLCVSNDESINSDFKIEGKILISVFANLF